MWILLGTVITTSFFDSLNPSAIAEQMLLQAMVKNKRHIWFFILGIGTANLALGLPSITALLHGFQNCFPKPLKFIRGMYMARAGRRCTLLIVGNTSYCQNQTPCEKQ